MFNLKYKINMLARSSFDGFGNGSLNWDTAYTSVQKFVQTNIYGGIGILLFLTCLLAGGYVAFAPFSQNAEGQIHKGKRAILYALMGVVIMLSAGMFVAIADSIF